MNVRVEVSNRANGRLMSTTCPETDAHDILRELLSYVGVPDEELDRTIVRGAHPECDWSISQKDSPYH